MLKIFKYALDIADSQTINMPAKAEILTVQMQNGKPMLWALVDTTKEITPVQLITHGTGHTVTVDADLRKYINTYQIEGLVFHVFQLLQP